jgi:hypothetical protein
MNRKNLITVWKTIPLLCAFSFSVLMFVCVFCVNGTISALPFFASYIETGNSIFLPFIPRINLFCFLPEEAQILPFTFGHLLDFIILVNLSMVINPITLPFYKKVNDEYQNNLYYDLHIGATRPRQRTSCAILDVNRVAFLDKYRARDGAYQHGHQVGCVSLRVGSSEDRQRQDLVQPVTNKSFLHRSRGRLLELDLVSARIHLARAVIASLFAPKPLIFARYL